jgi:alcohol dehydrogenase class IV
MSLASLFGGIALANAGLGAVHGFAAPVGGMFDAPHGAVCAALLPHAMSMNIRALRARAPESEALRRYETIARVLTGDAAASPEDGVASVERLCQELAVPPLRMFGIGDRDVPELVQKAAKASSMKGNPVTLSGDELTELLVRAL